MTVAGAANGTSGSSLDSLYRNFGIFWADGILFIADSWNDRIVLIAPDSIRAVRLIGGSTQPNMFNTPCDVFVTRTSVYVMDTWNFRVQKWSKNFFYPVTVAGITGVNGSSTDMTKLSNAHKFFVDNYDNLFVSDLSNHRVMRYSWNSTSGTNGVIVAGTGVAGPTLDRLNGPMGVFVTDDGILYIADQGNHRIQKWVIGDTKGVTVAGTGICGRALFQLCRPTNILVDLNGYMYIADLRNHRILRWEPYAYAGECIVACSGDFGIGSSQLNTPTSIRFDASGSLYVNDWGNNRVQKFELFKETGMLLRLNVYFLMFVLCFIGQTTTPSTSATIRRTISTTSNLKTVDQFVLYL